MTIYDHYENFMSQPDIEEYTDLYCSILENRSDNWQPFYYGLLNEVTKDRALFDALMVEKIKTYSLNYDVPVILSDELHDEYLRQNVYDDGEF